MVLGTSGIGKTIFAFYLVYKLVCQAREEGNPIPTFELADAREHTHFLKVVEGKGVVSATGNSPDYVITDAVARINSGCKKKYIHIASLHNTHLRHLLNSIAPSKDCAEITFPVFSRDEYLESDETEGSAVCLYWLWLTCFLAIIQ